MRPPGLYSIRIDGIYTDLVHRKLQLEYIQSLDNLKIYPKFYFGMNININTDILKNEIDYQLGIINKELEYLFPKFVNRDDEVDYEFIENFKLTSILGREYYLTDNKFYFYYRDKKHTFYVLHNIEIMNTIYSVYDKNEIPYKNTDLIYNPVSGVIKSLSSKIISKDIYADMRINYKMLPLEYHDDYNKSVTTLSDISKKLVKPSI